MTPFLCMAGTSSQVTLMVVDDAALALTSVGGAPGAAVEKDDAHKKFRNKELNHTIFLCPLCDIATVRTKANDG